MKKGGNCQNSIFVSFISEEHDKIGIICERKPKKSGKIWYFLDFLANILGFVGNYLYFQVFLSVSTYMFTFC